MPQPFPKIAQLKTVERFRRRLQELEISLPVDDELATSEQASPLAQPTKFGNRVVGNRWCIHPMEGWDGNRDGTPSEKTFRRWQRFGQSGAKLIWGGEAVAVRMDGRANPNQLVATQSRHAGLGQLRAALIDRHRELHGSSDDLLVGLQLTHSGRYARPNDSRLEPRIAYHHPVLDARVGIEFTDQSCVWTDGELDGLIGDFVDAAKVAESTGFDFVDVKACHGYLLHELLGAHTRPGPYGGGFEGRTRLLQTIIQEVQRACPSLLIGVRLSVFDFPPFVPAEGGGKPVDLHDLLPYRFGFGMNPMQPLEMDLDEPIELLRRLCALGVAAANLTCGSPYYTPHIQRPAAFPPSDGYAPPEDPLVGVARQINMAAKCKDAVPDLTMVGSGYSYLQEFLPFVAQAVVRMGWIDCVGLGRMVLSYPSLPSDVLRGAVLSRPQICRTFSDCTTAPRNGMPSGCFPLDPFYKEMPESKTIRKLRRDVHE